MAKCAAAEKKHCVLSVRCGKFRKKRRKSFFVPYLAAEHGRIRYLRGYNERWVKRHDPPMLNTCTIRMNPSLRILEFKDMTEEWPDLNTHPSNHFPYTFFHVRSDWIYGTKNKEQKKRCHQCLRAGRNYKNLPARRRISQRQDRHCQRP